jgi:lipid II:glycine glycyltransferase (peptidoglycan interpeptide bridge formation enzyme)
MIKINYEFNLFKLDRVWFPLNFDDVGSNSDLIRYLRVLSPKINKKNIITDLDYTILTDLRESEDSLLSKIKKNVAYEIKRAKNENIKISRFFSKDLLEHNDILNDFELVYFEFSKLIGLNEVEKAYDKPTINSYIENDCFLLTCAEYENGKVYHAYVCDDKNTVLIFSASDFRSGNVDKALAGRANKLLHWNDILYFKENGLFLYDWGNISSIDNPNGIDRFKMSFGGTPTKIYNIFVANSFFGHLLICGKKLVNKIEKFKRKREKS